MTAHIQGANFGAASHGGVPADSLSFNVNVTSTGPGVFLVVGTGGSSGTIPFIADVKLGGVSMTALSGGSASSGLSQCKLWYFQNPPSGTTAVSVTEGFNTALGAWFWAVIEDAAGPPTGATKLEYASADITQTVSTPAGGVAVAVGQCVSGGGAALAGTTGLNVAQNDDVAGTGKSSSGYATGASIGFSFGFPNVDKTMAVAVFAGAAVASFSGALSSDDATLAGSFTTAPPSSFAGGISADDATLSGIFGSALGTLALPPLKRLASGTVPVYAPVGALTWLNVRLLADGSQVAHYTDKAVGALGVVAPLSSALFMPGFDYFVTWLEATGAFGHAVVRAA